MKFNEIVLRSEKLMKEYSGLDVDIEALKQDIINAQINLKDQFEISVFSNYEETNADYVFSAYIQGGGGSFLTLDSGTTTNEQVAVIDRDTENVIQDVLKQLFDGFNCLIVFY